MENGNTITYGIQVGIVNKSPYEIPSYGKLGNSGMDLKAFISEPITLKPLERVLIPTGIYLDIPLGYEIQVRPRSGLALKRGLTVLNTPGTVDSNYTGEVGVIIVNLSSENQTIEPGERVAQMVLAKVEDMHLIETNEINKETERGSQGYGDSGRF